MEIWKPLRNFPSYNGSSEGRIMNVRTQRILKTYLDSKGREQVCLRKNNRPYTISVHKLIAETFLGEHPGMDVRHRDLDPTNNRVDNLYYSTRKETINDSFERGDRLPNHRTPIRVIETGEIYESVSACSRATGCARSDIFKQMAGTASHVKGLHFERV
jgi:hypothetical protein